MTKPIASYDPFDPEVIENPWAFYEALRHEAPLYELPNKAYWLISRYEDVRKAALDVETFSSNLVAVLTKGDADGAPQLLNMTGMTAGDPNAPVDALAVADAPVHTRQRRVSNKAFSIRSVASMEEDIRKLVDGLLEPILQRGECDWVRDFAIPLPMTMIIRLLGLPLQDMPQLKLWSDCAIGMLSGLTTPEQVMVQGMELLKMVGYFGAQLDLKQQNLGTDVISDLLRASEADAEALSRAELISILAQLVTAGNETTTSLLGSALRCMLQTPGLQQTLRAEPSKIPAFLEEVLRLETPLKGHFRLVKKDTEVAGQPLPAGSRVMLLWTAANRDESAYESAAKLDLERARTNPHTAFGYGVHHCLGAALGRAEARIALEVLLARTKDISLTADNDFRHVPSLLVRSLRKLNVRLEPA